MLLYKIYLSKTDLIFDCIGNTLNCQFEYCYERYSINVPDVQYNLINHVWKMQIQSFVGRMRK